MAKKINIRMKEESSLLKFHSHLLLLCLIIQQGKCFVLYKGFKARTNRDSSFHFRPTLSISRINEQASSKEQENSNTKISIPVLYESENVLAIDKPPHIPHHNTDEEIGILSHVRNLQNQEEFPYNGRLYGVHRLDRVTSGILLFAKNKETAISLSDAFRKKEITKYYVALTGKKPKKKKQGWVRGGMSPSRRGMWKLTNNMDDNPAITRFYSAGLGNCNLESFCEDLVEEEDDNFDINHNFHQEKSLNPTKLHAKTMLLFHPHTGKTHQLRVAAKSLGMPILGDKMYGDSVEAEIFGRTYLHALAIDVIVNEEHVTIFNPPDWFTLNVCNTKSNGIYAGAILQTLLEKHCQNEAILNKAKGYYS